MARIIPPSELVLNEQGLPYHIGIGKEQLSENIILVGDQGRVKSVGKYLSNIDHENHNREFFSITGSYNGKRVSVLSTGIGTDNIDIVVNELDAAVNFDLDSRTPLKELTSLNLIRIGTCGALQSDLPVNSTVVSEWAIGLDGVRHFYAIEEHRDEERIRTMLEAFLGDDLHMNPLYVARARQAAPAVLLDEAAVEGQAAIEAPPARGGLHGVDGDARRQARRALGALLAHQL